MIIIECLNSFHFNSLTIYAFTQQPKGQLRSKYESDKQNQNKPYTYGKHNEASYVMQYQKYSSFYSCLHTCKLNSSPKPITKWA